MLNLKCMNETSRTIRLTWNEPSNPYGIITGYEVTWNATNDPKSNETNTLTYSVKNLGKFCDASAALKCMSTSFPARFQVKFQVCYLLSASCRVRVRDTFYKRFDLLSPKRNQSIAESFVVKQWNVALAIFCTLWKFSLRRTY